MMAEMRSVGERIKALEKDLVRYEETLGGLLLDMPNLPHASVPRGRTAEDNPVLKTVGQPPLFDFQPQGHWDIGEQLGILDFARAARIAGARFPLYIGAGARLERALINFMLESIPANTATPRCCRRLSSTANP
jgi:seryl-tRNA synthetase